MSLTPWLSRTSRKTSSALQFRTHEEKKHIELLLSYTKQTQKWNQHGPQTVEVNQLNRNTLTTTLPNPAQRAHQSQIPRPTQPSTPSTANPTPQHSSAHPAEPNPRPTWPSAPTSVSSHFFSKIEPVWGMMQSSGHKRSKRRWKKFARVCLHLLGLREAAPTTKNAKYFTHHFDLKSLDSYGKKN